MTGSNVGLSSIGQFHHVGVACRDLDAEQAKFALLGYVREGEDFSDPVQGVSGRFLVGGGPRVELLVGISDTSVLTPWLRTGQKMYHLAYLVRDMASAIRRLESQRAKIAVAPVPAAAFAGRKIAFLLLPNLLLIELIEAA